MSIFGVNVDPEKSFESLPNEVLRIVLGQLSFLKRKSVDRVSKIWRFLNHSFHSGETADLVGGALLDAAEKGDRETIFKLMDCIKEVKTERSEKEGWIWRALRVAAKKGNFNCMPPLWVAFDEISSIKNFDFSSPSIFEISEEEQDVDLQEIEQAIDNMVSEDDIEKLKLIFNDPQRALRWRIAYAFRALKVFIANNQVNCMDLLLSEIKEQRGRFFLLPESCVMFMAERDRPECFKRVFDKYRHFLSLATKPVAGVFSFSFFISLKGKNCTAAWNILRSKVEVARSSRKRAREDDLQSEENNPKKKSRTLILSNANSSKKEGDSEDDNQNENKRREDWCRIC